MAEERSRQARWSEMLAMPATLRRLATTLRGPPQPGENLRAADALDVAAEALDALSALDQAAVHVVRSFDDVVGRRPPAVEALAEALRHHLGRTGTSR